MSKTAEQADDDRFELADTVFVGRTLEEYERLFDLDLDDLDGVSVLDCPGGPCAFTPRADERGTDATAADLLYGRSPREVARRAESGVDTLRSTFENDGNPEAFCWEFYDSVESMLQRFSTAAEQFLDHYSEHWNTDSYRQVRLPTLPFDDDAFDLVLSAHFLFVYGETFSYEFHEQTLRELCRVSAEEVRVAPITEQREERTYRHLQQLRESIEAAGYTTHRRESRLPLFSDDPEMLVVRN